MAQDKSNFKLGVITLLSLAGALVSGYLTYTIVGITTLAVFAVKSFLLGSGISVVVTGKKRVLAKDHKSRQWNEYKFVEDPAGRWFISGFGLIVVILSVLLVAGILSLTVLFVFLFGFMFVYSGAADEFMGPQDEGTGSRKFVVGLSYLIIAFVVLWALSAFFIWVWPYLAPFFGE